MRRTVRSFVLPAAAVVTALLLVLGGGLAPASAAPPAHVITGHIYLGDVGTPAAAGAVTVTLKKYVDGRPQPLPGVSATTDASGAYTFTGLTPGIYNLVLDYSGSGQFLAHTEPYSSIFAGSTHDETIPYAYSMAGRVSLGTAGSFAGAGDILITATSSAGLSSTAFTDSNGFYDLGRLRSVADGWVLKYEYQGSEEYPDWYYTGDPIGAASSNYRVTTSADRADYDVVVGFGPSISGRLLTSDGAAAAGYEVVLLGINPMYGYPERIRVTQTDANGRYGFHGLANGWGYTVAWGQGDGDGQYDDAATGTAPDGSFFRDGTTYRPSTDEHLSLPDGSVYVEASISVDVTWPAALDSAMAGPTSSHIQIEWLDPMTGMWSEISTFGSASSDRHHATMSGLVPGRYRVSVDSVHGPDPYDKVSSGVLVLAEGQALDLQLSLTPGARFGAPAIAALYSSLGGAEGELGPATSGVSTSSANGGGSFQHYAGGSIYSSAYGGTHVVWAGATRDAYLAANAASGPWGWPETDLGCHGWRDCHQSFTHGNGESSFPRPLVPTQAPVFTSTPRAGVPVSVEPPTFSAAATSTSYIWRRDDGRLTRTTAPSFTPVSGDSGHTFTVTAIGLAPGYERATVTSAPSGTVAPDTLSLLNTLYAETGGSVGPLGPRNGGSGTYAVNGGGTLEHFTWGSIYATNARGAVVLPAGGIRDTFFAANSIFGVYGWPYGPQVCTATACSQEFSGGTITAPLLAQTQVPTIRGGLRAGETLTVSPGTYSPAATSYSYAWYRGEVRIPGATGSTYLLAATDVGQAVRVEVTARRAGSASLVTMTEPSATVTPSAAQAIAALYASSGGASGQLGAVVSAVYPYTDAGGGSLQHFAKGTIYSSNRGGTWIVPADATREIYWAASSIYGVYGWPAGEQTCTADSCTQVFTGGTITTTRMTVNSAPAITGTARVGETLSVGTGVFVPAATSTSYTWLRDGTAIPGATTAKYVLVAADRGHVISATVTGIRVGSLPATATAAVTTVVAPSAAISIADLHASSGGASGPLGAALGPVYPYPDAGGGSLQHFAGGTIYSSNRGGTWIVPVGPIRETYWAASSIYGIYGWPSGAQSCTGGICTQAFTGGTITPQPLDVTRAPVLTGEAKVGSTLTAVVGLYSPAPSAYAYAWFRDGGRIAGASGATYVLTSADLGHSVQAEVTATRSARVATATLTAPIATVGPGNPTLSPIPTISGTPKVGTTLTAATGTWASGTTFVYEWLAAGVVIAGAGDATFVPGVAEFGRTISVRVTATNPAYATTVRTSAASAAVAATAFATAPVPTVPGTPQVGVQLTADPGPWSPTATFGYQWSAGGVVIVGANQQTFAPTGAQLGKTLTVTVTATSTGYTTTARISTPTSAVLAGVYSATPNPVLPATAAVGARLTASSAGWDPGTTFTYRWFADSVPIPSATANSYVPTAAQIGETITVRLTTTTPGYPTVVRESAATAAVARGSFALSPTPTITGTPRTTATLTAVTGAWDTGTTFTYQWFANGSAIVGAETSTYRPTPDVVGAAITVRVIGSLPGYASTPRTSAPTGAVG